jgi:hypothetical protein
MQDESKDKSHLNNKYAIKSLEDSYRNKITTNGWTKELPEKIKYSRCGNGGILRHVDG